MPMLIIFFVTKKCQRIPKLTKIVKIEGEGLHVFWKSHKKQGCAFSLENSFLEKPKEMKSSCQLTPYSPFRLRGLYLKALFPSLVYKSRLTKRDIFTWVTLSILCIIFKRIFQVVLRGLQLLWWCYRQLLKADKMLTVSLKDF